MTTKSLAPTRRDLLKVIGLGSAGAAIGCKPPLESTQGLRSSDATTAWAGLGDESLDAFPIGVQCGDPHPSELLFWSKHILANDVQIHLYEWDGEAWQEVITEPVTVSDEGFIHHVITGLTFDRPHAYQFEDSEGRFSPVGHRRTAMADDQQGVVRFAATSCTRINHEPFPALSGVMSHGPVDFFLFTGDTVYADSADNAEEWSQLWERTFNTLGFRDVLANTNTGYIWDDHEVMNEWGTEETDDYRIEQGMNAFFNYTSTRRNSENPNRAYRSFKYGAGVEVFVLDCRSERNPEIDQYISEEQMQWVIDGLTKSTATWKVVVNTVPISDLPGIFDSDPFPADRWEGYPEQRERLLDAITDNNLTGVMFISGDIHTPCIARVEASGPRNNIFEFIVGPGGSGPTPAGIYILVGEQFPWADMDFSATRFDLDPSGHARIAYIRDSGEILCEAYVDVYGNVTSISWMELDHG